MSPHEKAAKKIGGDSCVAPAASREVALGLVLIFEVFTELPLRLFCKLLTIFLKKLKISKMKVAQLFKLYNFVLMNIFKFWLHFEI